MKKYFAHIVFIATLIFFIFNHLNFALNDTRGYLEGHDVGYLSGINQISNNLISKESLDFTKSFFALTFKIIQKNYTNLRLLMLVFFLVFLYLFYDFIKRQTKSFYIASFGVLFLLSMPGIIVQSRLIWPQLYSGCFLFFALKFFRKKSSIFFNIIAWSILSVAVCFHYSALLYAFIIAAYFKFWLPDKYYKPVAFLSIISGIFAAFIMFYLSYKQTGILFDSLELYDTYIVFFANKYLSYLFLLFFILAVMTYLIRVKNHNVLFNILCFIAFISIAHRSLDAQIFCFSFIIGFTVREFFALNKPKSNVFLYIFVSLIALTINTYPQVISAGEDELPIHNRLFGLHIKQEPNDVLKYLEEFLGDIKQGERSVVFGCLSFDYYYPDSGIISELDIFLKKSKTTKIKTKSMVFHDTTFTHRNYPVVMEKNSIDFMDVDFFLFDIFYDSKYQSKYHTEVMQILKKAKHMDYFSEFKGKNKVTYVYKNSSK